MSIQTMLTQLRVEVDDLEKTRWSDDQLKVFLGKSIRRVNQLAIRHELSFAQKIMDVTLKADGSIPEIDYNNVNAVCLLVRKDNNEPLQQLYPMHWNVLQSPGTAEFWTFENGSAYFKTPGTEDIPGKFIFYPRMDVNTTESPWDGRLDDIVVEYAALRAKNVDEMNAQMDMQLMQELENRLLDNFSRLEPQIAPMRGWIR